MKDSNPLIIAEIGINHGGNLSKALKYIDAAKYAGCNVVKFQTYKTEYRYKKKDNIYNILKKCELSFDDFFKIKKYCDNSKIIFSSTPFDLDSFNFLKDIETKIIKIASFDLRNIKFLREVLKFRNQIIISTGMGKIQDIDRVYKLAFKLKTKINLLHCISSYPNLEKNSYLSNIKILKERYKCPIGISDHTQDIKVALYAFLMGAEIIEKHIKLNNFDNCVDKNVSITTEKFLSLTQKIKDAKDIIGKTKFGIKRIEKNSIKFRRITH